MADFWTDWKFGGAAVSTNSIRSGSANTAWTNPGNTLTGAGEATTASNKDETQVVAHHSFSWGFPAKGTVTPLTLEQRQAGLTGSALIRELNWSAGSQQEWTEGSGNLQALGITKAHLEAQGTGGFISGMSFGGESGNTVRRVGSIEHRVEYTWTYVPPAPSGFSVGKTPEAQANLTWTASPGDTCIIQHSAAANGGSASGPWFELAKVDANLGSYDDIGEAGENWYRIAFVGSDGDGTYTAAQSITISGGAGGDSQIYLGNTQIGADQLYLGGNKIGEVYLGGTKMWPPTGGELPKPDAPVLTLVGTDPEAVTVDLSWTAVTDAVEYEIWRDHGNGYILHAQTSGTTFQDQGVSGQTYKYYVRAGTIAGGLSDPSNDVVAVFSPFSLVLTDTFTSPQETGTSFTIPGAAFGEADPDRKIFVCLYSSGAANAAATGCTIGGVTATLVDNHNQTNNQWQLSMWAADVPNGASGDIVFTGDSDFATNRAMVSVYRGVGYNDVPSDSVQVQDYAGGLSSNLNLTATADGAILTQATGANNSVGLTLSGTDTEQDVDQAIEGRTHGSGKIEPTTAGAKTLTWTLGAGANHLAHAVALPQIPRALNWRRAGSATMTANGTSVSGSITRQNANPNRKYLVMFATSGATHTSGGTCELTFGGTNYGSADESLTNDIGGGLDLELSYWYITDQGADPGNNNFSVSWFSTAVAALCAVYEIEAANNTVARSLIRDAGTNPLNFQNLAYDRQGTAFFLGRSTDSSNPSWSPSSPVFTDINVTANSRRFATGYWDAGVSGDMPANITMQIGSGSVYGFHVVLER